MLRYGGDPAHHRSPQASRRSAFSNRLLSLVDKSTFPLLERTLEGGLHKGAITEIISPNPSARLGLAHSQLAANCATRSLFLLALIDGSDSFDVYDSDALQHLLWVRCEKASEAVKAVDFLCVTAISRW